MKRYISAILIPCLLIQLYDSIINEVLGLRFYMDNFIVRFDAGFGNEITGVYFNFGHIF